MELNVEIWGDSTHQVLQSNVYSNHITVSDVIPDIYTYYDTIGMNNPIDNSIALWQIGDGSWFNRYLWLRRDNNNVIQTAETATLNAKSLWLCVPVTYATSNNIHFNPEQYQCNIWDSDSTSTYYNQPNANLRGIVTGFDYNRLQLRVRVHCALYNSETKEHSTTGATMSVYDYFHESDAQDRPYKDYYALEYFQIFVGTNDGVDRTVETINLNSPKSISASGRLYTNTLYNTPPSSDGYYKPEYIYYCQNNNIFGIGRTPKTNIPQQAVYASNTSYYIGGFDSIYWNLDEFQVGSTWYVATRCTAPYEEVLRQLAFFGLWFNEKDNGGSITNVIGENCSDDWIILPEIVGGRTTGNFKRGLAAGADTQATWGNNWRENVNYTGDKPYKDDQKNSGDLTSVFHRPSITGSCLYYNLAESEMRDLITFINSGYQPVNNDQFILDFKGTNPADYISSIIYYPTDFTCANYDIIQRGIGIGALSGLDTGVQGYIADITKNNVIDFEPLPIPGKFFDFRDFAPYTQLDLYVPFCGNVELDPSVFIGHTLNVNLIIDYPTGNCTGVILCDNLVYDTINGSCGVSIPLTALNVGSYQNAIKSAEIALKQAEIQRKTAWLSVAGSGLAVIGGAAMGNPLAIAGGVAGIVGALNSVERADLAVESAQYQLTHTAPTVRNVSAASPANGLMLDYDCHLLIKRATTPNGFDDAIYSHTVGNACAINAPLSSFSGYTVCADVDLSGISAPAEIKTAILNALKSGVYI